jgi:hypothetical protein
MNIEAIWYEYSPFVYATAGIFSVSNYGSIIPVVSGVLLIAHDPAHALGLSEKKGGKNQSG